MEEIKEIKEIKEKILENLEGVKEFEVCYSENVSYSKTFKAKSEEELREKFQNGELDFGWDDIFEGDLVEGSLNIEEQD